MSWVGPPTGTRGLFSADWWPNPRLKPNFGGEYAAYPTVWFPAQATVYNMSFSINRLKIRNCVVKKYSSKNCNTNFLSYTVYNAFISCFKCLITYAINYKYNLRIQISNLRNSNIVFFDKMISNEKVVNYKVA